MTPKDHITTDNPTASGSPHPTNVGARPASPGEPHDNSPYTLYCQGHTIPAIAARLGLPEATVQDAINAALKSRLSDPHQLDPRIQRQLAIDRTLAISTAAWQSYERVSQFDQLALDLLQNGSHDELAALRPRLSPLGPRYLHTALASERELVRLTGCAPTSTARASASPSHAGVGAMPASPVGSDDPTNPDNTDDPYPPTRIVYQFRQDGPDNLPPYLLKAWHAFRQQFGLTDQGDLPSPEAVAHLTHHADPFDPEPLYADEHAYATAYDHILDDLRARHRAEDRAAQAAWRARHDPLAPTPNADPTPTDSTNPNP
ncbi:MAG: hypothetical protein OJF49_001734 [Ktedonobacterales bacterium]|jgi:hypothetical protein|nr:MAG: hypothetical protein OJF49_001734 [Ktedonobacterales bacterium]